MGRSRKKGKLKCLSKDCTEKGKEDKENGVTEEHQKKWKLSRSSYNSSKFGKTVDHASKQTVPLAPKWIEAFMSQ